MPSGGFIDLTITGADGVQVLHRRVATYELRLTDHTEPLQQIGQDVLREVDANFAGQGGRYGPWAPLAPSTIQQRIRQGYGAGPILQRTGEMRGSFRILELTPHSMSVGSHNWKARIHHGGAPRANIPARPLIGWSWNMRQLVVRRFNEWVLKILAEG